MGKLKTYKQLIRNYPILSDQMTKKRLDIILRQLEQILIKNIPGSIVEFGCYIGTTSVFLKRLINQHDPSISFHVYDSFKGLPHKSIKDASVAGSGFRSGELKASKRQLLKTFKKSQLKPPIIHKGWFNELKDKDIPSEIAYAFLDGDFYSSISDSLELVWPRLVTGGNIVIDDFGKSNLPGVSRAVEDFFKDRPAKIRHEQDLAIITKP